MVIGVVAGLGAIVFYEALASHAPLPRRPRRLPGPDARREGGAPRRPVRAPLALPLIVGSGALLGGLLVFGFAPEAEGHGTDAAISAVHHNPRGCASAPWS